MIQLRQLLLRLAVSSSSTHVPLHSFSAPSGSLNLRCLSCALVSHVCSGVLRSLPVRVHSTQAVWSCFESELRSPLRVVVAHVLHDFLDFLSIKKMSSQSLLRCWFLGMSESLPLACGQLPAPTNTVCPRVDPSLHPVVATNASKYRISFKCNLDHMCVISGHALEFHRCGCATHKNVEL